MFSDLQALEVFVSLSETGSLQKTAADLGIENSAASRKLTKLESQLGRQLFNRNIRPITMTDDAKAILESARRMLEEKQNIETYYRRLQNDEQMPIRLMFGNGHINFAPKFILEYAQQFPRQRFYMISPSDVQDFLNGKADLLCLSGQAQLDDCILLPRGRMVFIPVASPAYLKEHGQIHHPDELAKHRVFNSLYTNPYSFQAHYNLTKGGKILGLHGIDTIRFSNVEMTHRAVLNGEGIAPCMPIFLCIEDLEAGRLVPVLDGWHRPSHRNYVACKKNDWKLHHIRTFASWWAKKLSAYERECEARLVSLYGRAFLLNLLH